MLLFSVSPLVSIFRGNRAFRENGVGYFQYHPKRYRQFFFVIANSFAVTTGSLVSNAIGAGARKRTFPDLSQGFMKLGYAVGFPLVVVALLCNRLDCKLLTLITNY